jgi:hypothetical protein
MYIDAYINALCDNLPEECIPKELDIILEGGALNGSYHLGVLMYLKYLETNKKLKVDRISGVSVGSLLGCLYFTSSFNESDKYFNKIISSYKKNGYIDNLKVVCNEIIKKEGENFYEKINKRLYISYYEYENKNYIVKSEYINNEDLIQTLISSCHLPGIINGDIKSEINALDGGYPFIFNDSCLSENTNKNNNKKTLFIRILSVDKILNILRTRNEKNTIMRASEGITNFHNFLFFKKSNKMCSYVEDWSMFDYLYQRIFEIIYIILLTLIISCHKVYKKIPENYLKNDFITSNCSLIKNLLKDLFTRFII